MEKLVIIVISLLMLSCTGTNECIQIYRDKLDFTRKPMIELDSVLYDSSNCIYTMSTFFELDSSNIGSGLFKLRENKIILKGMEPILTNDFEFFNFGMIVGDSSTIIINYGNNTKEFKTILENKLHPKPDLTVYQYTVKSQCSYFTIDLDATYFITKENGIIGSYLTSNNGGHDFIFSRAGRIFPELIDYSHFRTGRLQ